MKPLFRYTLIRIVATCNQKKIKNKMKKRKIELNLQMNSENKNYEICHFLRISPHRLSSRPHKSEMNNTKMEIALIKQFRISVRRYTRVGCSHAFCFRISLPHTIEWSVFVAAHAACSHLRREKETQRILVFGVAWSRTSSRCNRNCVPKHQ